MTSRHVNSITGRLSLRSPQRRSLEILDRVMEIAQPHKGGDLKSALDIIRSEFPSVEDFEHAFPSLCFALATGVGKTRLMGAFITYLHLEYGIRHFFVLAPNLTIYNKLLADFTPNTPKYVFQGIAEFAVKAPTLVLHCEGDLVVPVALIIKQPDLGTAILVLSAGLYVIFFAGLSWKLIIPVLLTGAVAITALVMSGDAICEPDVKWPGLRDYQKHRVCTLLDPSKDPLGKGFHTLQGMIAIGSGGVEGKGFMKGTQTHLEFIPERTTDFVFAAFSEEFGLVGCIGLVLGFTFLIFRGLMIASEAPTVFSRLLAGAITLSFFTYAFVNMGMVTGMLPVVGVPLPFMSFGGTALMTLFIAVGILMSVQTHRKLVNS